MLGAPTVAADGCIRLATQCTRSNGCTPLVRFAYVNVNSPRSGSHAARPYPYVGFASSQRGTASSRSRSWVGTLTPVAELFAAVVREEIARSAFRRVGV